MGEALRESGYVVIDDCTRIAACSAATWPTCCAASADLPPLRIDSAFVCSSATIANPRELAERLTGQPFALVDKSGAPRGEKYFVFVNPPVVNRELGIRRSYLAETRRVAVEFLRRDLQLIVFAQSRLSTEVLTTYLKDDFRDRQAARSIRGYRGGYLPLRRREIERGLREGRCEAWCRPTRWNWASTSGRSTCA